MDMGKVEISISRRSLSLEYPPSFPFRDSPTPLPLGPGSLQGLGKRVYVSMTPSPIIIECQSYFRKEMI